MFKNFIKSKRRILGLEVSDWLYIAIGLTIFAIITLWTITKSSIWFDESFGAYMIHFNFLEIARYTAADVHPPLYYWILKLWSMLFGNTELGLRSMSVMFGGISIIFGYLLTHRLFGKKAAKISLLFMVLSPMLIRYSQEARMYTLVVTIALAATYVLTFAINTKKRLPWITYGIMVGLGMWTHYFSALIWIAHWIWRADIIRRTVKKAQLLKTFFSKEWILAHIVAVGIFLPWLPFCIKQMTVVQVYGFWIPPVTPGTMINFLTNAVYYQDIGNVTGWLALGFIVLTALLAFFAFQVYKLQNNDEKQSYRLIIILAFVPMLILFMLSMPPLRSSFIDRYLITSIISIALLIGVTFSFGYKFIKPKWRFIMIVFVAVLMIIGISNVFYFGNYNKNTNTWNGTRLIIEAINAKSDSNQPIIASSVWLFYNASFYSTDNHPVFFIDPVNYQYGSTDMLKYNDQNKIKKINDFTKANPVFWYVGSSSTGELDSPYSNWEPIQEVSVKNAMNGEPAYRAIQYKIINE